MIFRMENWATYRESEGALMSYNSMSGRLEPVTSFNLDTIPEFDALLLFGGMIRSVKYAAQIMYLFNHKFGYYPEFLTVGAQSNKNEVLSVDINVLYEDLMLRFGFPEKVIMANHFQSTSTSTKGYIEDIKSCVSRNTSLRMIDRPRIAVVTGSAYSLRAAQELAYKLPDYEFCFFETPLIPEEERIFDYEKLDEGFGVDIVIANCWHSMNEASYGSERLSLSSSKLLLAPKREDVRHFVERGYTLFMFPDILEEFGFNATEVYQMRNERCIAVTGRDLAGEVHQKGLWEKKMQENDALLRKFEEQTCEEFMRKGIII